MVRNFIIIYPSNCSNRNFFIKGEFSDNVILNIIYRNKNTDNPIDNVFRKYFIQLRSIPSFITFIKGELTLIISIILDLDS